MSRLRHPIKSAREPFGKAGLIVAVLALVFALAGGAYAAGELTATASKAKPLTKAQVLALIKANSKPGPAGPAGANGTNGTNGTNGAGEPGAPGQNVTTKPIPTGEKTCNKQGGTEFISASGASKVCNGTTGFTKTLPSGETETGTWAFSYLAGPPPEEVLEPISFPIPLPSAIAFEHALFIEAGQSEKPGCEGSYEQPTAKPGFFCLYALSDINTTPPEIHTFESGQRQKSAGKTGAKLVFVPQAEGFTSGEGTWAVTAAE